MPSALCADVVRVEAGELSPMGFGALQQGFCTAQDESEVLVGELVAPAPGQRVLDLCAAPGGKTTHLAERMGDQGEVWALERSPERLASLRATIARHGATCVRVVGGDGLRYKFPHRFDRVLVDAPCSGLGVLARRADARWRKRESIIAEMPPVQLELLAAGARNLAPAGALVYSVCSFEPEETWQVIERFLARESGFRLDDAARTLPAAVVERGVLLTLPHRHGCDGAFAARLVRR
jgi:16S rRNA (cytosine967-C5)-methyltransferase